MLVGELLRRFIPGSRIMKRSEQHSTAEMKRFNLGRLRLQIIVKHKLNDGFDHQVQRHLVSCP